MNMKKKRVAATPVTIDAATHPLEIARKIVPTPQSPRMMPLVPSFRRNLRPFLSTSAQATTVITQFTILITASDMFANVSDVAIKIVNCVMTVVACALVDKKGRKFLLKLGTSGIILGLCGVGTIFLAISKGWVAASMTTGVLATLFFFMFIAFYAVGPGVCVWLALTELMPTRIRATGMSIAMIINQGVSAGIATVFPKWCAWTNDNGSVFFVLAGFTVIYFITAAFFLPETKGRTLEEVEQYFTTGKMPEKKV